jgi:NAD(P)-dependent dehydrogenase (short-subunit alcohol dehydrogenase family)
LLLDLMVKSATARVINVASAAHYSGTMELEDLGFERGYQIMRAYARSKLANVLFTRELAARLAGTNVTVNCLPAEGGAAVVYLATSPDLEGKTGALFRQRHSQGAVPLGARRRFGQAALGTKREDDEAGSLNYG